MTSPFLRPISAVDPNPLRHFSHAEPLYKLQLHAPFPPPWAHNNKKTLTLTFTESHLMPKQPRFRPSFAGGMEAEKRKQADDGEGEGKRIKISEGNTSTAAAAEPGDGEVEEFFAILRRLHAASKYFTKGHGGEAVRKGPPAAVARWSPSFRREDFLEADGEEEGPGILAKKKKGPGKWRRRGVWILTSYRYPNSTPVRLGWCRGSPIYNLLTKTKLPVNLSLSLSLSLFLSVF
ncbi:hypothetical protein NMG60_11018971 [Bertholletia excelsa]